MEILRKILKGVSALPLMALELSFFILIWPLPAFAWLYQDSEYAARHIAQIFYQCVWLAALVYAAAKVIF